jgi:hypothetical protein
MAYEKQPQTDWSSKEKRDLFCKAVNCYVMKSGADKDPVIDKILPIAQQIVDRAWELYPDKNEEEEEKPL